MMRYICQRVMRSTDAHRKMSYTTSSKILERIYYRNFSYGYVKLQRITFQTDTKTKD